MPAGFGYTGSHTIRDTQVMNDNVLQWRPKPLPDTTPPNPDSDLTTHERLRLDAEKHIEENTTPPSLSGPLGADVLTLLYRIATSPTGGSDALKLLHEFQVHQVELDMQYGQFEANEQAQAKELAHYRSLFNFAPIGYLVLSATGQIIEANKAIAELLCVQQAELCTHNFNYFLNVADTPHWQQLLQELKQGTTTTYCDLTLNCRGKNSRQFQISANLARDSKNIQMVLSEHKR
jgi:PAS domain S-box-containing protein